MRIKKITFKASRPAMLPQVFFVKVCPGEAHLSQPDPGCVLGGSDMPRDLRGGWSMSADLAGPGGSGCLAWLVEVSWPHGGWGVGRGPRCLTLVSPRAHGQPSLSHS